MKKLILKRVPPGDRWVDVDNQSELLDSLTEGLEYAFQKSKGKIKEFHLSAFEGKVFFKPKFVGSEDEGISTEPIKILNEDELGKMNI